jgi:tetratricopeptide (TPR) repeat protein
MSQSRTTGLLTLSLILAASAARADEVVLVPGATVKQAAGGRVRGTVQSETAAEVVVKLGATTVTVPAEQVASVRYDGQPASLALAESAENAGQLARAADQYKKAVSEASGKPLVERAARFKQAEVTADLALADPSRAAEAVALLDAFLRAFPDGRQAPAAREALARLQLQKGDYAAAEKTAAELARSPRSADRAALLRARVLARKGEHEQALTALNRLAASAPAGSNPSLNREARLARAESLAALKRYSEAETEARAVIKALPAEDAPSQSAAYNTLGDCLRAAGRPKDALLAYLHTDLLYAKDKEQHPRALAQIARLWRELNQEPRADEALKRLQAEYPQSPWAKLAAPAP